jgi:hypothetical protein
VRNRSQTNAKNDHLRREVCFINGWVDRQFIHRLEGLQNLRRYFELIVFQAYLQSTEADTLQTYQTFEAFVKNLPGRSERYSPGIPILTGMISDPDIRKGAPR